MLREDVYHQFYMVKEAAKRDFDYDRDKLRVAAQRQSGRILGVTAGSVLGTLPGKSMKSIVLGGVGGALAGGFVGDRLGPNFVRMSDDHLDKGVRRALMRNVKNKGTGRNSAVVRDLKRNYGLKVHRDYSKRR